MDKQKQQEAYKNYVKQKTPVHNLPLNMLKAFITGGIICTIGQGIFELLQAPWNRKRHQRRLDFHDSDSLKRLAHWI